MNFRLDQCTLNGPLELHIEGYHPRNRWWAALSVLLGAPVARPVVVAGCQFFGPRQPLLRRLRWALTGKAPLGGTGLLIKPAGPSASGSASPVGDRTPSVLESGGSSHQVP